MHIQSSAINLILLIKLSFINHDNIQDLFINRITEVIQKQEEKIRLYEAQSKAQSEETKAARALVTDATTEIDVIILFDQIQKRINVTVLFAIHIILIIIYLN